MHGEEGGVEGMKRCIALVAMLLMVNVATAQVPQPIPLQQRAKQLIPSTTGPVAPAAASAPSSAAPKSSPAMAPTNAASRAHYAHQLTLGVAAADQAQRVSAQEPLDDKSASVGTPAPRPGLLAPTLAPSPAAPGLIKAAESVVKPAAPKVIDPGLADLRSRPTPPRILPSALQAIPPAGNAAAPRTPPPSKMPAPLEETKPNAPLDDPFADPPGGRPSVVVPPEEMPKETPPENPLDTAPDPVIDPPATPSETPLPETPPAEQPEPPSDVVNEAPVPAPVVPPRAGPRPRIPRGPITPPRRPPETFPESPFAEEAPRQLEAPKPEPEPNLAPRPSQGVPMPAGVPPGPGAHYTGPDGFGYGPASEAFAPRTPRPVVGLGGATFNGYYDRNCPPDFPLPECGSCRLPGGTWATFDYLMWWSRGASLPALVTTGSQNFGGTLSDPAVKVIFGNQRVDTDLRSGGRLNIGTWLDCERTFGLGGAFFDLQRSVTNFDASSPGNPLIARPYFDTVTQLNDSSIIARNGVASGMVHARTTNNVVGADAYMRIGLERGHGRMLDFVQGYRFFQMDDSIRIDDRVVSTDQDGPIPLGTSIAGSDRFSATNQFHGWQFGLQGERRMGRVTLGSAAKFALGNMHQVANIDGYNVVEVPGEVPVVRNGNLLALPSNIGRYQRNTFGFIPEFNLNLGYQVTSRLRANVGYTFLWVNRVAQAGRQINTSIDSNQLFGEPGNAPSFQWQQNSYWVQGLNLGIDYRF